MLEREAQYRAIFEAAGDGLEVWDLETERLVEVNPAHCRMHGFTRDELLAEPPPAFIHPDDAPLFRSFLDTVRGGGEFRGRVRDVRKDGTIMPVEVVGKTFTFNGKPHVLGVLRDISEQERAEAILAARAQQADLHADVGAALASTGPLPEVLQHCVEALVRHLDAAFARIWGLNEAEQTVEPQASAGSSTHLDGYDSRVSIGRSEIGLVADKRQPLLTNDALGDPRITNKEWVQNNGIVAFAGYPLLVEDRVVGVLALFARHPLADHTEADLAGIADAVAQYIERKRAQDTLQQREQYFRSLIEHAHDIITILGEDGTIRYESPAIERVLGFGQTELVGRNAFEFVHPEDRSATRETFVELLSRPGAAAPTLFRFRHADGSWRWLEAVGYNLLANPTVKGVVVNSRDATERQLAQAALERSEKRFRALIEHSSDVITLTRPDGILSYASPSTTWVLGYDPSELVGGHALVRVHADDRGIVEQALIEDQEAPGKTVVARYRTRHRDGSWHWVETTLTNLIDEPAVGAIVANRRDVTAEVEAQQALEQRVADRTRELTTLLQVSRAMSTTLQLESLLDLLLDQLRAIIDYSAVGIHVPGENGGYTMLAYTGPLPRERMLGIPQAPGLAALVRESEVRAGPVIVEDFGGESPSLARLLAEGVSLPPEAYGHAHALLVAPLIVKGRNVGGLLLVHRVPGYYTERHAQLAMAFAQQAAAAVENARLYEAARGLAALEERQRLARELHDSVSQALYAIALNSAAAGESLQKRDTRRATRLVKDVRLLARAGLAEMRALIFELRAESLAEEGLVAALTKQAEAIEARHELAVRLVTAPEPDVPLQVKEALYRIAQEGLHNVVKHAEARSAEIAFDLADEQLALSVRDDGRGFEVTEGLGLPGHLGLRSMRERAERLGGRLEVSSRPGSGTLVRVVLPLARSA
jgi:PAS domain S-box-containing protein